MLLGKRQRQVPIKRTTSMSEITFDLNDITAEGNGSEAVGAPCDPHQIRQRQQAVAAAAAVTLFGGQQLDQRFLAAAMVSPRGHRRASADFLGTAHFLRSCSLCKRRLVPSRDIYMYRGDSAFCSLECRQQQMNQDERMEKCSLASKKEVAAASSTTVGPEVSAKGETVAAL